MSDLDKMDDATRRRDWWHRCAFNVNIAGGFCWAGLLIFDSCFWYFFAGLAASMVAQVWIFMAHGSVNQNMR